MVPVCDDDLSLFGFVEVVLDVGEGLAAVALGAVLVLVLSRSLAGVEEEAEVFLAGSEALARVSEVLELAVLVSGTCALALLAVEVLVACVPFPRRRELLPLVALAPL